MNFKDFIRDYIAPGHPLNQTGGFASGLVGTLLNFAFPGVGTLITRTVNRLAPTPRLISPDATRLPTFLTNRQETPTMDTPFQAAFQGAYGASPSDLFPGLNLEQFSVNYDQGASLSSLFPSLIGRTLQDISNLPQSLGIGQNPLIPQYSVTAHACPPKLTARGMKGQHLSKPHKGSTPHCVTNRHMNSLNPHALRRATRRLSSFHSFAAKAEKEMQKAFRKGGFHAPKRSAGKCSTCRKTRCSCA
jgi:hypothetical protein